MIKMGNVEEVDGGFGEEKKRRLDIMNFRRDDRCIREVKSIGLEFKNEVWVRGKDLVKMVCS